MDSLNKILQILDAETYAHLIQDAGILVDVKVIQVLYELPFVFPMLVDDFSKYSTFIKYQQRKKTIMEHSNDLAKSVHGHIVMKSDLLDEVTGEVSDLSYSIVRRIVFKHFPGCLGRKSC